MCKCKRTWLQSGSMKIGSLNMTIAAWHMSARLEAGNICRLKGKGSLASIDGSRQERRMSNLTGFERLEAWEPEQGNR